MSFFVSRPSNSSSLRREPVQERVHRVVEPARQVLAQAADADVAGEEAEAGDELVDVQQQLALAHGVEQHRHGADFHAVRAQPDQMAGQPLQLGEQHADVLHALRHLQPEQLLDARARTPGCWTARPGSPSARPAGSPAATSSARRSSRCRCAGSRWSGMTDWMTSPSSSSTSRSTPCVLGCWGPMLTVIVSVRISGMVVAPSVRAARASRDRVRGSRGTAPR